MTSKTVSLILLLSSLTSFLSIAIAQGRAPHGLANENPMALSPSAYEFFHPTIDKPNSAGPCSTGRSSCSPLPMAAQVEATSKAQERETMASHGGRPGLGAGGVAGMVFGITFAVLAAMGAYYVVVTRRQNLNRAKTVQPST